MSELDDFAEEFAPLASRHAPNPHLRCSHLGAHGRRGCFNKPSVLIGGKAYCAAHAPKSAA